MKLMVCAVGRLRRGPEADLIADYARRLERTGRAQGIGPLSFEEVEDKRGGGRDAEAGLLRQAARGAERRVALDERGTTLDSRGLAAQLAKWRDQGVGTTAFLIGGADGLQPELTGEADLTLSFGPMVWPHMLARVMLSEQLYRAAGILAGTPYHRD